MRKTKSPWTAEIMRDTKFDVTEATRFEQAGTSTDCR